MTGSNTVRWGAVAAMLGGVASILEFIIFPISLGLAQTLLLAAYLLAAVGLIGFHALQEGSYGRIGQGSLYTASLGSLAAILATAASLLEGASFDLLHTVGASLLILGYVLYGIATLRAGVLPHWCGMAFIMVGPVTFALLGFGGSTTIVFGLFWLTLGYALWSQRGVSVRQPSSSLS